MNIKIVFASIVVILGILGILGRARGVPQVSSAETKKATSTLVAAEVLYDFGTISMKNGLVDHVFKITNAGVRDVNVKKITTSCMCTSAYIKSASGEKGPFGMEGMGYVPPADELIKAGDARNVRVVYNPNAHGPAGVGVIDRLIYLADDAGGVFTLEIKAVVTP